MFVSGTDPRGGEIFKFSWDGKQSIFASGLHYPGDLAVDSAGNLFVVDRVCGDLFGDAVIYKMTGSTFPKRMDILCLRVELRFQPGD